MNYKPEVAAGIELDSNTAEDLAEHGHNVYLYVPRPSRGISKEEAKKTPKKEKLIDGRLQIYRYEMFAEGRSLKQRLLRYFLCSIKQLWFGLRMKKIDLIFAGSTPPFQGVVCSWIKKIRKVPFVFNCQDIFPESMVIAGITTEGSRLFRIGNIIADITYKAADKIIVISQSMKETLIEKGVLPSKIEIVYNWVDENVIHPVERKDNRLIKELSIPDYEFTVVYAGNLGYAQGIDVILEAAERLKTDQRIGFVIFGNGPMEGDVKEKTKELERVKIYPLQPYARVSEVYSTGNACIVSCKKGTGGVAMPSKTWSIMGCGRPVLVSFDRGSLLESIVEKNDCGLFSNAGDSESLVKNILKLCNAPERTKQQGRNGRTYIEQNLSRKSCTDRICAIIDNVGGKK